MEALAEFELCMGRLASPCQLSPVDLEVRGSGVFLLLSSVSPCPSQASAVLSAFYLE